MDVLFEVKVRKPLKKVHLEQLHDYCVWASQDKSFITAGKQYWKRHEEIMEWISLSFAMLDKSKKEQ